MRQTYHLHVRGKHASVRRLPIYWRMEGIRVRINARPFKPVWRLRRSHMQQRPTRNALQRAWAVKRWGRLYDPDCPF